MFVHQVGFQLISIPVVENLDTLDAIILMEFNRHRGKLPRRWNQTDQPALQSMKRAESRLADSGIRYDAVLVSEAVQVVVLSMLPGVLPEWPVPSQPLHQRTPACSDPSSWTACGIVVPCVT